ncbi:MAG: uroporphyrinogen-III synthase [Gammaproteobacteria bacterium]
MSSSNNRSLNGATVLVTRPEGQGDALCQLIEAAGGRAVSFPVMVIQPLDDADTRRRLQSALAGCDTVIFVSRNAVYWARELLPDPAADLAGRIICAAGAATRRELQNAGISDVVHTESTRASEDLLARPELAADRVAGRQVLIVRGEGGRELLTEELQKRGATVQRLAIYRRVLPQVAPDKIRSLWHDRKPDVIVITSVTGLYNLVELTPEACRPVLFATPLAVISERIRKAAEEAGFTVKPVVAASASDPELVRAVIACTESV